MPLFDEQKTIVLDGHRYTIRRPRTDEAIAWVKGIPALIPGKAAAPPEPAMINESIRLYLVKVDDQAYDSKADPPETFPFAIAMPLYNEIYNVAIPEDEAALARRVL